MPNPRRRSLFGRRLVIIALLTLSSAHASASSLTPALREQVSLNGDWAVGGTVPRYGGEEVSAKTYRRKVTVPANWGGRLVRLEFRQVNFIADIYLDERHIAQHVGAWVPFSVDLTQHVKPGQTFDLRVEVKSGAHRPYVDAQGKPLWPVGTYQYPADAYTSHKHTGIADDVWLRAYGQLSIEDVFIKTSFRKKSVSVEYTVANHTKTDRTIFLRANITPANGKAAVKRIESKPFVLPGGQTKTLVITEGWPDPELWMPDAPTLYHLNSRLMSGGEVLDEETRRFGFREIWTAGNQFMLNGVRVNLLGDSIVTGGWQDTSPLEPSVWPQTIDMLMNKLNMRVIRWHQHPGADYMFAAADEKGLMIIDESALYGMQYYAVNDERLVENTVNSWVPAWIKGHRNHPSIVMWSAQNEMGYCENLGVFNHRRLLGEQLLRIGDAILRADESRPVTHAGDWCVGVFQSAASLHYPEGYEKLHTGSIYKYGRLVLRNVPTGVGEFLASPWVEAIKPAVFWQHGNVVRGLRYTNFTDIRPFTMRWAWNDEQPEAKEYLRNSFAQVAFFDKEYDDLGIAPLMKAEYPALRAGAAISRSLILYNDEYRERAVTVEVLVRAGARTLARGNKTFDLAPGEHIDISCGFQAPDTGGEILDLVLTTFKNGVKKFEETKRFRVTGRAGPTAEAVTLAPAAPASVN